MVLVQYTSTQGLSTYKAHVDSCIFCSHWDMFHTNIKYEKWQRAITLILGSGGLWFLFSALLLNEIYTPLKCYVRICNSLRDIAPTSLWRTNIRTDNAKSISFGLWWGIINPVVSTHDLLLLEHRTL